MLQIIDAWLNCLHRFRRARRGAAGIEFALLFPVLLVMVAASIDLNEALYAKRKTTQIASSVAGFLADQNQWKKAEVDDLLTAASFIMRPFKTDDLKIVLSVLTVSKDGTVKVAASQAIGTKPLVAGTSSPIAVPVAIRTPDVQLVLAQVNYTLATPFSTLWPIIAVDDKFVFSQYYFARPRRSDKIVIE